MYSNILFENVGGIAHLTIDRPDKLNALNIQTISEINQAFEHVYNDESIKAVIITGSGEKAFVAGADISEIAELNEMNARGFAESGQEVFASIENCHKPGDRISEWICSWWWLRTSYVLSHARSNSQCQIWTT